MKIPKNITKHQTWKGMNSFEWLAFIALAEKQYSFEKNGYTYHQYYTGTNEQLMEYLKMPRSTYFRTIASMKEKNILEIREKEGKKIFILKPFWEEDGKFS